jgi:hypothetical protein
MKISRNQILTMERAIRRQEEIDARPLGGFETKHKVHRSKKAYRRNNKHKGREF